MDWDMDWTIVLLDIGCEKNSSCCSFFETLDLARSKDVRKRGAGVLGVLGQAGVIGRRGSMPFHSFKDLEQI